MSLEYVTLAIQKGIKNVHNVAIQNTHGVMLVVLSNAKIADMMNVWMEYNA